MHLRFCWTVNCLFVQPLTLNPIDFNEYQEANFKTPPSLFQLSVCTQIQGYSFKIELNYYGLTEDGHFYYQEQCNHKSQQLMTLTPISQSPETVWPTQSQPHAPGTRNRGEYYWIWHPGVQWAGSSHDANSTDHELPELQCCTCHSSKHKVNNT